MSTNCKMLHGKIRMSPPACERVNRFSCQNVVISQIGHADMAFYIVSPIGKVIFKRIIKQISSHSSHTFIIFTLRQYTDVASKVLHKSSKINGSI